MAAPLWIFNNEKNVTMYKLKYNELCVGKFIDFRQKNGKWIKVKI